MPARALLAVIAHPSDEVFNFGSALAHAAERGVKVTLACATRGEGGQAPEGREPGAQREAELRRACTLLGLEPPVFLGYHDSGGLSAARRDDPLALVNADPLEVETRIRAVIEREAPQVILTFDPRGGNGHPDKRAVYQATSAAFQFAGHLGAPPRRLFLVARPLTFMQRLAALPSGPWVNTDPHLYAASGDVVAARLDARGQRPRVVAAARAHASQPLSRLGDDLLDEVYGPALDWPTFALGGSRGPLPRWPVEDLFEGLA